MIIDHWSPARNAAQALTEFPRGAIRWYPAGGEGLYFLIFGTIDEDEPDSLLRQEARLVRRGLAALGLEVCEFDTHPCGWATSWAMVVRPKASAAAAAARPDYRGQQELAVLEMRLVDLAWKAWRTARGIRATRARRSSDPQPATAALPVGPPAASPKTTKRRPPRIGEHTGHKQVWVEWRYEGAYIDEELAPLIRALWQQGLRTCNSCQENQPGVAWIEFPTAEDAAAFLDLVAEYEPGLDTLYNRITHRWDPTKGSLSAPFWEYSVWPEDAALQQDITEGDEVEERHAGRPEFSFAVSVRFPRSDLPAILRRFPAYDPGPQEGEATRDDAA
jgi:hypothetical protein